MTLEMPPLLALPRLDAPPFVPPVWLAGSHAQTVLGGLGRPRPRAVAATEEVRLFRMEDGAELTSLCNWLPGPERERRRTLVVVHGLTGDARSSYMYGTAEKALAAGMNAVRLNLRGAGDLGPENREIYNAGVSGDLGAVLDELAAEGHRLAVAGFSLGGNVALKLAAERGEALAEVADGVVAVSAPIDLARSCDELDRTPMNRLYQRVFLRDLRAKLARKHARWPERFPPERLAGVRTLREFDDRITAPLSGYGDADTYYARCSTAGRLHEVRVPVLLIHARDDTFVPFASFEGIGIEANPSLALLACERGGHSGFFGRRPRGDSRADGWRDRDRYWAENRAVQLAAALDASPATGGGKGPRSGP